MHLLCGRPVGLLERDEAGVSALPRARKLQKRCARAQRGLKESAAVCASAPNYHTSARTLGASMAPAPLQRN